MLARPWIEHQGLAMSKGVSPFCGCWRAELLGDFLKIKIKCKEKVNLLVAQSCLTLCNPMDCSPPGSSVYGISQARIQERVAIPFSRASSQASGQVSCTADKFFIFWATREALRWNVPPLKSMKGPGIWNMSKWKLKYLGGSCNSSL